jgi:hypothetical protein
MTEEKLYTTAEVAELTGYHHYSVTRIAQKHGLGRKFGRTYVLSEADLEFIRKLDPKGGRPPKSDRPD